MSRYRITVETTVEYGYLAYTQCGLEVEAETSEELQQILKSLHNKDGRNYDAECLGNDVYI